MRERFAFRDTFDIWFERSQSATASVLQLGSARVVGRRQENHAFSLFLKSLSFVRESHLFPFFSFSDCEKRTITAKNHVDSIVTDGTAFLTRLQTVWPQGST